MPAIDYPSLILPNWQQYAIPSWGHSHLQFGSIIRKRDIMTTIFDTVILGAVLIFMVVGLVSVIIPIVPGVLIIWLAALAFALQDKFSAPGPIMFGLITLVAIVGASADLWMSIFGAKVGGTSLWGMLAGGVLGVIGLIVFFPLGGIIGATAGVIIVELMRSGDVRSALLSGGGTLGGYLLTTVIQLVFGALIIAAFVASVLLPLSF